MARDDWRIRIELEEERAGGFLEHLGLDLGSHARELAKELEEDRLPVSRDGETIFVYASSGAQAQRARKVVEAELEEAGIKPLVVLVEHWLAGEERWDDEPKHESWEEAGIKPLVVLVEHWLAGEERWDDEPKHESWEEDVLARGYAPWEVRVECRSHHDADALADRLEQEGFDVARRWRYLIVGAPSREEAQKLARRLHGEVEPGGELVWEAMPRNPFAVFGGFGG